MKIDLIGCGCGEETLTQEACAAIDNAEMIIGSKRLLNQYGKEKPGIEAVTASEIAAAIQNAPCGRTCVLYSGDLGFYSGARLLPPQLAGAELHFIPGISSLQLLSARLGRPWQDWLLCSAHGVDCDIVAAVCKCRPAFFLTGGTNTPATLCRTLTEAGLGMLPVTVGEDLGTQAEQISAGTAAVFAEKSFSPLSVLLAEAAPRPAARAPGLPDEAFLRADSLPMTKQELRAAILAKLAVGPDDLCWDIGTGTGSVAIELALQCRAVYSIERVDAALQLAQQNRVKHGAWNLRLVKGEAPAALASLPKPDAVFIGGSGGQLRPILEAVYKANINARVCVSAISLEGLHNSYAIMQELGWEAEVCQIAVSRGKKTGGLTLLLSQNPVFLITGTRL